MSFKEKLLEEWESTQELLSDMDPYKDKDAYRALAENAGGDSSLYSGNLNRIGDNILYSEFKHP